MPSRRTAARLLLAALASLPLAAPPTPASARTLPRESNPSSIVFEVSPASETVAGTQLTLTATVSNAFEGPIVAGLMVFGDGEQEAGRATVDVTGTASITYVPATVGVHHLTASYTGSAPDFTPASSDVVDHSVVAGDPVFVPPVEVRASPSWRAPAGTVLELSANVYGSIEDARVRGQVEFLDGGRVVATAPIEVHDDHTEVSATYAVPRGARRLAARYVGNPPDISPSTSRVTIYSGLPSVCPDQARPGNGALVRLAYLSVLGRCPDPAGFAYWTEHLDDAPSAPALGRGLALSSEGIGATVDAAYRKVLGRPADPGGRAVWSAKLRSGWTTSQLWAALAASPEFLAGVSGSDPVAGLVDRAFTRIVGRSVDAASADYWYERFASGFRRWAALRALILTPESLGHVLDEAFRGTIGRASPDERSGYSAAITARRGDWRTLAADLLARPSAYGYAQSYPDPAG